MEQEDVFFWLEVVETDFDTAEIHHNMHKAAYQLLDQPWKFCFFFLKFSFSRSSSLNFFRAT
jgi:hypothetical protein